MIPMFTQLVCLQFQSFLQLIDLSPYRAPENQFPSLYISTNCMPDARMHENLDTSAAVLLAVAWLYCLNRPQIGSWKLQSNCSLPGASMRIPFPRSRYQDVHQLHLSLMFPLMRMKIFRGEALMAIVLIFWGGLSPVLNFSILRYRFPVAYILKKVPFQ